MADFVDNCVVLGDRLLVKAKRSDERTSSGLFLPAGMKEKEQIQSGYVLKTGPGYAVAPGSDSENPWDSSKLQNVHYIPLEAQIGDLAIYLKNHAYEIEFGAEKYLIVPQSAVLLVIRED
jgi:co-chaperonin GroES (HSP10)